MPRPRASGNDTTEYYCSGLGVLCHSLMPRPRASGNDTTEYYCGGLGVSLRTASHTGTGSVAEDCFSIFNGLGVLRHSLVPRPECLGARLGVSLNTTLWAGIVLRIASVYWECC